MKIRLEIRVSLFCSEINFENFRQINGNFTDATIFPLPRQRKYGSICKISIDLTKISKLISLQNKET